MSGAQIEYGRHADFITEVNEQIDWGSPDKAMAPYDVWVDTYRLSVAKAKEYNPSALEWSAYWWKVLACMVTEFEGVTQKG